MGFCAVRVRCSALRLTAQGPTSLPLLVNRRADIIALNASTGRVKRLRRHKPRRMGRVTIS